MGFDRIGREKLEALERENAALKQRNECLAAEANALRHSLSWRVTAPFRWLHSLLSGPRRGEGSETAPPGDGVVERMTPQLMDHLRTFLRVKLSSFLSVGGARLRFPCHDTPVVSIVLVLYDRAEYTFQCLESLLAHADVPYEVIIYDNGSTDETRLLLERLDGVRIVRGTANVGFLRACNRASDEARGEWILFLNNDTQVLPSFLSELVGTASGQRKCAAVGAKLVNPDGFLQEAGCIVWRDGSCRAYGRGDDPDSPEYNFVREVDYCSGACLLVRRDLFISLGKFDERYVPAYYEETDFCMNVRSRGYRVFYQPRATIIHYEFGSAGSPGESLAIQGENRLRFREKWRDVLEQDHFPDSPDNFTFARDRSGKRRLLVVDDRIPDPALGSGYPRCHRILREMVRGGWQVTLFPVLDPGRPHPVTDELEKMGIECMYDVDPFCFERFLAGRRGFYDLVWISRPHNMKFVSDVVRRVIHGVPVVYDAEALFAARDVMRARLEGTPLPDEEEKKLIEGERSLLQQADALVAVSPRELEVLGEALVPEAPRVVLGHAFDVEPTRAGFDERHDILFVGGILASPSPNEDAVAYFVQEILPLVRREIDVRFWIVGTVEVESVRRLASEHVVVTGRVDDLRPFYESCRLFVVPTRYAGGIPYKLQEALAHGIPAVVTPLIADQLSLDESVVLVGDGPESFARKVVSLHGDRNLWESLRRSGLDYVAGECSSTAYSKRLITFLDEVVGRGPSRIQDGKDVIP